MSGAEAGTGGASASDTPVTEKYVLAVDIGSTSMRCFVVDQGVKFVASAVQPIEYMRPQEGYVEIDPEVIWERFVTVVKTAMANANIKTDQVASLGISVFRASFTTWHRETGELVHPIITWQDNRAAELSKTTNGSFLHKAMSTGARFLHTLTRAKRFLAASVIEYRSIFMNIRLAWVLKNIPKARQLADQGMLLVGSLDTFLLWRLSGGKVHAMDYSNASSSGLYDPFVASWSAFICHMMEVPMNCLPKVMDTGCHLCTTEEDIFGGPIEVHCVVADQQSSAFGQVCWDPGMVKLTLGSGSFVDFITRKPHGSGTGLYPVVAWSLQGELAYLAEGAAMSTGVCLEWAKSVGWFDNVADTSDMAKSVEDSNGVCFVPAMNGLQVPFKDPNACCSVFGIRVDTRRQHLVRAMLESFAFRVVQIIETAEEELGRTFDSIRVDGGVSRNDFLLQCIADLTGYKVMRADNLETTAMGAAFFAGLSCGFWSCRDLLKGKVTYSSVFEPRPDSVPRLKESRRLWEEAVSRSLAWYTHSDE